MQRRPGILHTKKTTCKCKQDAKRLHTLSLDVTFKARQRGANSNSRAVFLDALATRSPLSFRVQLLDGGLDDLLLQRGVLLYHPPGSFQILGEVLPRHRLLHLLQTGQHLGGVARELLECHAHLAKGATIIDIILCRPNTSKALVCTRRHSTLVGFTFQILFIPRNLRWTYASTGIAAEVECSICTPKIHVPFQILGKP